MAYKYRVEIKFIPTTMIPDIVFEFSGTYGSDSNDGWISFIERTSDNVAIQNNILKVRKFKREHILYYTVEKITKD